MTGGTPEITIAQWAILGRCRIPGWVSHEALMACAQEWFEPALSEAELVAILETLQARHWLEVDAGQRIARTTLAGSHIVDRFERPVGCAEGWNAFHPMRAAAAVRDGAASEGSSSAGRSGC